MRLYLLFPILCFLFSCDDVVVHPANITVSKVTYNLKGNVKRVEAKVYTASGTAGTIVVGEFDSIQTKQEKYPLEFNRMGLLTLTHGASYPDYKPERTEYLYDESNRIKGQRKYVLDSLISTVEVTYLGDSAVDELHTDVKGDTLFALSFTYKIDPDTMYIKYYRSGEFSGESKRLINSKIIHEKSEMAYDDYTMKYDIKRFYKKGALTESIFVNDFSGEKRTVRSKYNKQEDPLSRIADERDDFNLSWSYTYDNQGNWIERVQYINDTANSLIKREITYF